MVRFLMLILVGLCSLLYAAEEPVTLSGTVKDSAGKPLEGVTVALAKLKTLSMITKADGAFKLSNVTAILRAENQKSSFNLTFKNNCFVFTSSTGKISGTISIFSAEGRLISTINLNNITTEQKQVALPELSSGMYLLAGKVGGESFTQPLVCMGNNLYLRNETAETQNNGLFSLRKRTAVVDTLIASKVEYDTTRIPLNSYSSDTIKIVLNKKGVFTITSTKFVNGDTMPKEYTCNGKTMGSEKAPPLKWSGAPAGTKSYAMTFLDTSLFASANPSMGYHYAIWNIPDSITKMPEGLSGTSPSPEMGGATQKSALGTKFFGPCPNQPADNCSKTDTYVFTLYTFNQAKISPTSTSIMTLVSWFSKNAIDSTKISVKSKASTTGCP